MNPSSAKTLEWCAAVLTPPGRGAVATIAIQADLESLQHSAQPGTLFQARNQRPLHKQQINRILFGHWGAEDLVACRTADNQLEVHCHGGRAAIERILTDLQDQGVQTVPARRWLAGNADHATAQIAADYEQALSRARTFRTAEFLWQQRQLGLDFWTQLAAGNFPSDQQALEKSVAWISFGRHLTVPWNVVIAGLPNVGKSSLINALLGYERAIVFDQPGTTRDIVTGETALSGWPVMFSDTAGQRETEQVIEAAGIELAVQALQQADLQILLIDGSQPADASTKALQAQFPQAMIVLNKTDLPLHADWLVDSSSRAPLKISCATGHGLAPLMETIVARLVPEVPDSETIYPVTDWQEHLLRLHLEPRC